MAWLKADEVPLDDVSIVEVVALPKLKPLGHEAWEPRAPLPQADQPERGEQQWARLEEGLVPVRVLASHDDCKCITGMNSMNRRAFP